MDTLDQQLLQLLKVNARLPIVKLAKALGCARSTVQLRLKALEDSGTINGYTVSSGHPRRAGHIEALVLIAIDSKIETDVVRAVSRRHEVSKLFSVSGRYDLCALVGTESTQELDTVLDRIREIKGVSDTFSTVILSTKLDRPD